MEPRTPCCVVAQGWEVRTETQLEERELEMKMMEVDLERDGDEDGDGGDGDDVAFLASPPYRDFVGCGWWDPQAWAGHVSGNVSQVVAC